MEPIPDMFRAGKAGPVEMNGETWMLTVHGLGILNVPSGLIGAYDPFVTIGDEDAPQLQVTPGSYRVELTLADVSDKQDGSHFREAYLSVIVRNGVATALAPL